MKDKASTDVGRSEKQTDGAYDQIRRMILENEIRPGSHTLQEVLAERVGMSRTPVREALIRLEREGLIEIRPRHGMYVLPVSPDDMRDIYDVLTALEGQAALRLGERGLDESKLSELEQAVKKMDVALEQDNLAEWARADDTFHWLLVKFAGNKRLQAMVSAVIDQAYRVRRLTLRLRPKPTRSNDDHRALVEAIRNRDAHQAWTIHTEHRRLSGKMLCELLETLNRDAF